MIFLTIPLGLFFLSQQITTPNQKVQFINFNYNSLKKLGKPKSRQHKNASIHQFKNQQTKRPYIYLKQFAFNVLELLVYLSILVK